MQHVCLLRLMLILQETKTEHIFEVCVFNRPGILRGQRTMASCQVRPSLPQETFPAEPRLRCLNSKRDRLSPQARSFRNGMSNHTHSGLSWCQPGRASHWTGHSPSSHLPATAWGGRQRCQVYIPWGTAHQNNMRECTKGRNTNDSPGMSQRWHIRQVKHNYDRWEIQKKNNMILKLKPIKLFQLVNLISVNCLICLHQTQTS